MAFKFSITLIMLAVCLTSHSRIDAFFVAQCPRSLWRTPLDSKISSMSSRRDHIRRDSSRVVCTADTTTADAFKPTPWSPARDAQEYRENRLFGSRRLGDLRMCPFLTNALNSLVHTWPYPPPCLTMTSMSTTGLKFRKIKLRLRDRALAALDRHVLRAQDARLFGSKRLARAAQAMYREKVHISFLMLNKITESHT
jgi:hypothetical protein